MITKEEATKLANKYGFKLEVSDLKFTNSKREEPDSPTKKFLWCDECKQSIEQEEYDAHVEACALNAKTLAESKPIICEKCGNPCDHKNRYTPICQTCAEKIKSEASKDNEGTSYEFFAEMQGGGFDD